MKFKSRYVHKISPRETDLGPEIELTDRELADRRTLGKALREHKILGAGESVHHYRREPGGVVVFPKNPKGLTTGWHAIVLETPLHKKYVARGQRRFAAESRYRKALIRHGQPSFIQGEKLHQLRARATRHVRTR